MAATKVSDLSNAVFCDRLKLLYPAVNEVDSPLPRQWNAKDKFHNYLGLSHGNLRVQYKGSGKTHKDAASVRASHPIPAACGIYYFEVKVISKGRDGYMGIGLSTGSVNLNRLPGWEKESYGYHGDDGYSFCSSGTGQPYGPTFTTGDIIGCCVNLVERTCFYTKNGINIGIAFRNLPHDLYPTVGLQTPGEVAEANFGQLPFVYSIEDYIQEWRLKIHQTVECFPIANKCKDWPAALHRLVSTYLIHHGYCASAEAFLHSTQEAFEEELVSIKNRQKIQNLVLNGHLSEAINMTEELYPGLLENDVNLLFMLKCRQFIEIINGTDTDTTSPQPSSKHHVIGRTLCIGGGSSSGSNRSSPCSSPTRRNLSSGDSSRKSPSRGSVDRSDGRSPVSKRPHTTSAANNGFADVTIAHFPPHNNACCNDVDMSSEDTGVATNGFSVNGHDHDRISNGVDDAKMDCSDAQQRSSPSGNQLEQQRTTATIERILKFGRDLHSFSIRLKREFGKNEANKKALRDAFSLLAYSDPKTSPVSYQLNPSQREPICMALNSAILEMQGLPKQPPLELAITHASQCLRVMSKAGIGSCAFVDIVDYLR